jgi:hypothetical protein
MEVRVVRALRTLKDPEDGEPWWEKDELLIETFPKSGIFRNESMKPGWTGIDIRTVESKPGWFEEVEPRAWRDAPNYGWCRGEYEKELSIVQRDLAMLKEREAWLIGVID